MILNFHDLFRIKLVGVPEWFCRLFKLEYPNFIEPKENAAPIDLEIIYGAVPPKSLPNPFFEFCYGPSAVGAKQNYKTARWELGLFLDSSTTRLYYRGNRSSSLFFIGEILEPLMRYLLLKKGVAMLHSSCVAVNGKGILVSGIRHTGKTFFMLKSLFKGASLLSDDFTFIDKNQNAFCYPKRINFFLSHFNEIRELDLVFRKMSLGSKIELYCYHVMRLLTCDYVVLGHKKFIHELLPEVATPNSVPLKQLVLLVCKPEEDFSIRHAVDKTAALKMMIANNQWESLAFQKMMTAYHFDNGEGFPITWQKQEIDLLSDIVDGLNIIEIVIPDFSEKNVQRISQEIDTLMSAQA